MKVLHFFTFLVGAHTIGRVRPPRNRVAAPPRAWDRHSACAARCNGAAGHSEKEAGVGRGRRRGLGGREGAAGPGAPFLGRFSAVHAVHLGRLGSGLNSKTASGNAKWLSGSLSGVVRGRKSRGHDRKKRGEGPEETVLVPQRSRILHGRRGIHRRDVFRLLECTYYISIPLSREGSVRVTGAG